MNILKKLNYFIKYILFLFLLTILIDLIINLLIPEKFKKKIGTTKNYSLKSKKFHHEIAPNINLPEFWGDNKYQVITNEYGMRVNKTYNFNRNKKNIGFIGDSFVYGSGLDYKYHFLNLLFKNDNTNNYLNLAYVSYSPSIYFKRLKYFIEEKKINFKSIYVFIDTSDIQDEGIFYREDKNGNIVRKWNSDKKNKFQNFKYPFKNYLKQNSFIYKFYDNISFKTINKDQLKCIKARGNLTNFIEYLDYERFGYAHDLRIQKKNWVIEGQMKTLTYLSKIKELLNVNNIDLKLVYYPSAIDVLKGNKNFLKSSHFNFLNKWSKKNNIEIINVSNDFNSKSNPITNYTDNYIACDVHWNLNGHNIIANNILPTLK